MNELATTSAASPFSGVVAFEAAQRMARALATSTLVPEAFRGDQNIGNILIALEMQQRIGCSFMTVVQNLHVIQGRPSFAATFLIGSVNACGRFSPLRFEFTGEGESRGCRARAQDKATGEQCEGTVVTIAMAKGQGWFTRSGSKWPSMPDQMLSYRAAAFWVRLYCPELALGMHTVEELRDTPPETERPEIRTVTPTPVVAETPVTTVTVTAVTQEPDPAPVVTDPVDIDKLRAAVVSAFKTAGISWPQVQAAAVAGQWWNYAETTAFKDLTIESYEYLLKRVDRIARRLKSVEAPTPESEAPTATT